MRIASKRLGVVLSAALVLTILSAASAQYGGGTAQDPYQIATAADLILLGESPGDCAKHFILTADIDLDPNRLGRKLYCRDRNVLLARFCAVGIQGSARTSRSSLFGMLCGPDDSWTATKGGPHV